MGLLDENDADDIVKKIKSWIPEKKDTETQYETDLYNYLNDCFSEETFHKQYTKGKTRADIYIDFDEGASVAIEVKKDLKDRTEYHRLIGQTYEYLSEWKVEVVVVLCGTNDPSLVKLTRKALEFFNENFNPKVRFVEKRH